MRIENLDEKTKKVSFIAFEKVVEDIYGEDGDVEGVKSYILIQKLFVPSECRNLGIGRKLILEAIAKIKQDYKDTKIMLSADPDFEEGNIDQESLVKFYDSVGFYILDDQFGHGVFMEMDI